MPFSFVARKFRNISIRSKLSIIAIVATVPTAILLYAVLRNQSADADVAHREERGVEYILPLERLQQQVEQRRGLAAAFLSGDVTYAGRLEQKTTDVDNALKAYLDADRKLGAQLKLGSRAQTIAQDWAALKAAAHALTARESSDRHSAFIANDIIPAIYAAGNASGLLRDPQAASYHLAVAMVSDIPGATEAVGLARAYGVAPLVHRGKRLGLAQLSSDDRDTINGYFGQIQVAPALTTQELQAAIAAEHALAASLTPRLTAADEALKQFTETASASLFRPDGLDGDPGPYIDAAGAAIDAMFAISTTASANLHTLLNTRVDAADRTITISLAVAIGGIGVATLLIMLVVLNTTRRIGRLVAVADKISMGELDAELDVHGRDEIGELAASLGRMQSSLQAAITRLRMRRAV